jgi:hypothetical protein
MPSSAIEYRNAVTSGGVQEVMKLSHRVPYILSLAFTVEEEEEEGNAIEYYRPI